MKDYVDVEALGQVLLVSLLGGVGLVAAFSLGLVGISAANDRRVAPGLGRPAALALAGTCFAVVLLGVGLGLWTLTAG